MPFKEKNEYCWKSETGNRLDKSPICFKGTKGQKEALKDIPNWQNELRKFIDQLINKKPS